MVTFEYVKRERNKPERQFLADKLTQLRLDFSDSAACAGLGCAEVLVLVLNVSINVCTVSVARSAANRTLT